MTGRRLGFAALFAGASVLGLGCSHADFNPTPAASASATASATGSSQPTATPTGTTPTATPTGSPAACNTPAPSGVEYVAAGLYIAPATDPTYGQVYGYALADALGDVPVTASVVRVSPGTQLQFVNVDPANSDGSNGNNHSAVGFETSDFPAPPYAFPPAAATATATTFTNTALWSTGVLPSTAAAPCYSQVFTVPASGVFYFGDLSFYNSLDMRDLIVVTSGAATIRGRPLRVSRTAR